MNEATVSRQCCGSATCHSRKPAVVEPHTEHPIALSPSVFHFAVPGDPCSCWRTTGAHIVVDGKCRCGRRFVVSEQLAEPTAA